MISRRAVLGGLSSAALVGGWPGRAVAEPAPETTAIRLDRGFTARYEYAEQAMKELPYARWRQYDPEDSVRFYALGLHEAGMVKGSPQKLIADGTDWRFLRELQKELKA